MDKGKVIVLFDVDGTLTPSRQDAKPEMQEVLKELRKKVSTAIVGGSDISKICQQLGQNAIKENAFVFAENGCVSFKNGEPIVSDKTLKTFLGEDKTKELSAWLDDYCKNVPTPEKASEFVEWRTGMVNASPIGRSCTQAQRDAFYAWDNEHKLREKMVGLLKEKFGAYGIQFSIGGQISIDIFPKGWDKTLCLEYLHGFEQIHFFGDKTMPGGNDHEIYHSPKVIGHSVTGPEDTIRQLKELFLK